MPAMKMEKVMGPKAEERKGVKRTTVYLLPVAQMCSLYPRLLPMRYEVVQALLTKRVREEVSFDFGALCSF
jgi:hypothetical protein